jgi:hypothetical protein
MILAFRLLAPTLLSETGIRGCDHLVSSAPGNRLGRPNTWLPSERPDLRVIPSENVAKVVDCPPAQCRLVNALEGGVFEVIPVAPQFIAVIHRPLIERLVAQQWQRHPESAGLLDEV